MAELLIGEVAKQAGVATSTIRYYESIGLLPSPPRVNGRRRYDANVIQNIKLIRTAQSASWSLSEIREMFFGVPDHSSLAERWRARTPQKVAELDALIEQTQKMKLMLERGADCHCNTIDECVLVNDYTGK